MRSHFTASDFTSAANSPCVAGADRRSRREAAAGLRLLLNAAGVAVDLVEDLLRRAARRKQRKPGLRREIGKTLLGERRHIRHIGHALGRRRAEHPQHAFAHELDVRTHRHERDLHVADDDRLGRRAGAAMRHHHELQAGAAGEFALRQVGGRACAGAGIADLVDIGLGIGDELLQVRRRNPRVRVHVRNSGTVPTGPIGTRSLSGS